MGTKTSIAWTEATWNPVTGCSKVSPGCAHCYAETLSLRYRRSKLPWTAENAAENVVLHPERLDVPLHWRKPRIVFVNSMSDVFHERIPDDFIGKIFAVMATSEQHTFQVLTKRPHRMAELLSSPVWRDRYVSSRPWPLSNVWLGVSAENQRWSDERIPLLLKTPAAVRFISAEPLLGSIDLAEWLPLDSGDPTDKLDWVIVGGESGPRHRPMDLAWARSIRQQCRTAGTAYFGKQDAALHSGAPLPADLGDKEWPTNRRVSSV